MESGRLLIQLRKGETATIVSLLTKDMRHLRKLMVFGILPGTQIIVLQTFPVMVLQIGYTQLALDREIAEQITVGYV